MSERFAQSTYMGDSSLNHTDPVEARWLVWGRSAFAVAVVLVLVARHANVARIPLAQFEDGVSGERARRCHGHDGCPPRGGAGFTPASALAVKDRRCYARRSNEYQNRSTKARGSPIRC